MITVLGGLLENAMVRKFDEERNPSRNDTNHEYYISLNRDVDQLVKTRCDTLLTISSSVRVPMVDWGFPTETAFSFIEVCEVQIPTDAKILADFLVSNRAFSDDIYDKISEVDTSSAEREDSKITVQALKKSSACMYVERLLEQIRASGEAGGMLVLMDSEVLVLTELSKFVSERNLPTPFDIPDMTSSQVINANSIGVLTNFAAADLKQLEAVRGDTVVRQYSSEVMKVLSKGTFDDSEAQLIFAMREARENQKFLDKYDKGFELFSWMLKPLNYVPGLSLGASIASDTIAAFQKWTNRKSEHVSWYLLGARLEEVKIEEYLARKDNFR